MSESLPVVYLARHGETEWTITRQHTGRTDLRLTRRGEDNAGPSERLRVLAFDRVFVSPLQRARWTCELAGFGDRAVSIADLTEWDYGSYEGRPPMKSAATGPAGISSATVARAASRSWTSVPAPTG